MSTAAERELKYIKGDILNVKMLGLVADAVEFTDGAISNTSHDLTSASNAFATAVVGMVVTVSGAGTSGGWLTTTIATVVGPGHVTTTAAASTTVTAAGGIFGTDNAGFIANLVSVCRDTNKRRIYFPSGWYLTTATWEIVDGEVEIVGEGKDNSASSVLAYVGTSAAIYVHPTSLSDQTFAVNSRHLAVITYGGATDGIKLRNLSQGVFVGVSINDSAVGTATRGLNLINPNILTFRDLIITRSTGAAITIESTGFPFDATNIVFSGGNLYQNDKVFDLRAQLNHLTVRDAHIEQFTKLIYADRAVGASNLGLNRMVFRDNEILGSTGSYTSDILEFVVSGIDTLSCTMFSFRDNQVFFGTARKNPFKLTVDNTATFLGDWNLKANVWGTVDTSLILAILNPLNSLLDLYEENNPKFFGSVFTIEDSTNTGIRRHTPVYGGDKLVDTFRVPFTDIAGHVLTDRGANDSGMQYYPTTQSSSALKGILVLQSDCTEGQLEIADKIFSRVMKVRVPTSTGYANLDFAGAIAGLKVNGLLEVTDIATFDQPGASAIMKLNSSHQVVSGKVDLTNGGAFSDVTLPGITGGHVLIKDPSSDKVAGGGIAVYFGAGVADNDIMKADVTNGQLKTATAADICAAIGMSVGHTHTYTAPATHVHGGVTAGITNTSGATGGSTDTTSGPS